MKTDDPSYVMKIDTATGKTIWRVERLSDAAKSRRTRTRRRPGRANGRAELVITGGDVVSGHDPVSGKEFWRADVLNPSGRATTGSWRRRRSSGDLIIAPSRNNPMVAIRPGGKGDVATSHVAWTFAQDRTCRRR